MKSQSCNCQTQLQLTSKFSTTFSFLTPTSGWARANRLSHPHSSGSPVTYHPYSLFTLLPHSLTSHPLQLWLLVISSGSWAYCIPFWLQPLLPTLPKDQSSILHLYHCIYALWGWGSSTDERGYTGLNLPLPNAAGGIMLNCLVQMMTAQSGDTQPPRDRAILKIYGILKQFNKHLPSYTPDAVFQELVICWKFL